MLIFVVLFNLALALILLYAAWRVWRLRRPIGQVADKILAYERSINVVLHKAPNAITKGQVGVSQLRQKQQQLRPQLQRIRQVLALIGLGQRIWQQFVRTRRTQLFQKSLAKYK
ncbi:MAG: hypothetical protein JOZ78_13880 [Chroococcidiopsidaceae cyanobacterium CP_BM_ER_R8_30]|nr:hypothetical protein [Chroococcidiopsidaceae cyanobacterium CP_BM_ER_R8_30]